MTRHRHHIPNMALAHRAATHLLVAASLLILASANVQAQTSPARGPLAASADMPMEDYLGLLRQIVVAHHLQEVQAPGQQPEREQHHQRDHAQPGLEAPELGFGVAQFGHGEAGILCFL